jgi:hypothetical protein
LLYQSARLAARAVVLAAVGFVLLMVASQGADAATTGPQVAVPKPPAVAVPKPPAVAVPKPPAVAVPKPQAVAVPKP